MSKRTPRYRKPLSPAAAARADRCDVNEADTPLEPGAVEACVTNEPDGTWIRLGPFETRVDAARMLEKVLKAVAE